MCLFEPHFVLSTVCAFYISEKLITVGSHLCAGADCGLIDEWEWLFKHRSPYFVFPMHARKTLVTVVLDSQKNGATLGRECHQTSNHFKKREASIDHVWSYTGTGLSISLLDQ